MDIYLLGTGTAIPIQNHSPAGLVIKATDGGFFLFDIGPGTLGRLHLADVAYNRLDHLFLTHLHPDHTLDLATLFLAFNYAPNAERTAPFHITGCRGLEDFLKRMFDLYPEIVPIPFELNLQTVYRNEFSIGNLKIKSAPTMHTPESVAYRVEDGRHSIVYSGDVNPRGELTELANGADLLISECSFPSGWETEDHLNADMVGEIAKQAGVKSVILTHSYPPALAVDLAAQVRQHFTGKVHCAYDGMHISL